MPVFLLSLPWVLSDLMAEAGHAAGEVDTTGGNKYKQIFGLRTVHLLSIWALIYVGVEVTLGGVSFYYALHMNFSLRGISRLDCHFHRRKERRRRLGGLHIFWLLWRYVAPCHPTSMHHSQILKV